MPCSTASGRAGPPAARRAPATCPPPMPPSKGAGTMFATQDTTRRTPQAPDPPTRHHPPPPSPPHTPPTKEAKTFLETQHPPGRPPHPPHPLTRHDQHGRYPQAETVDDFRHNLATVQARMAAACRRAGRDPASVRLLPVSK